MPQFTYKAKKEDGSIVTGILQAESERGALDSLGRMGVFPLELSSRDETEAAPAPAARRGRRRARRADVALFTRQLGDLLKAGVPLNRALRTLAAQTSNQELSGVVAEIEKAVSAGSSLHEALGRFPRLFPPLYASMVRAGETGGFLEDALRRLASFLEKDEELRSRIASALAYPALLIVIGTFAVGFLMVFFIPRFSEIFAKLGDDLPVPTRIVMAASSFVRDGWPFLLGGLAVAMVLGRRAGETRRGRRVLDRLRLRAPLFGEVVRKSAVARFARTLGTLLKSGVPILEALSISKEALGNAILRDDVDEAAAGVRQGRSLAEILRRTRSFPPMVTDMIAVGEESGNLDEVLLQVADSYDAQVDRAVRVFVALFEPALLVLMAALVGFVVISMLLPVFSLSSMIR
ncbi:MAG TPA: type II secretion system F family protein [Planctomycetota bacterium]|nr:type II secretion system F family protein [Planctomycetota bacterium]